MLENSCRGCMLAGDLKACMAANCLVHDIWIASRLSLEVSKKDAMIDALIEENTLLRQRF